MKPFADLLLELWRQIGREIQLSESADGIAELLARRMPLGLLVIRQFDARRGTIETLAAAAPAPVAGLPEGRAALSGEEVESLRAWCRLGRVARLSDEAAEPARLAARGILPRDLGADVLVGPLPVDDDRWGIVLLAAARRRFAPRDVELAGALLEPLAVAARNDHRFREMEALREAAEAEKQSLLTKLGRRKLGDTIIGETTGLRAVMERVALVARSDVPVLIFGETGSGKELIARTIHERSPRRAGPFIRVNCGAIPPELIDSQLFGHERGAFTGAVESHKGWFERADGGTLLLDEIGELPPAAQVRLLRIVQDGWLERVGSRHPINVDVRIVAATHRDLAAMVAEGRFREDLWYRIAVFPIVLPPLRERRGDIAELARHFAIRAATRFGLAHVPPTAEDIELLCSYPWPGNVRELAAVIDRAAILGDGRRLEVAKALGISRGAAPNAAAAAVDSSLARGAPAQSPFDLSLAPATQAVSWAAGGSARSVGDAPNPDEPAERPTIVGGEPPGHAAPPGSPKEPILAGPAPLAPLDEAMRRHIEAALRRSLGRIEGPFGAAALLKINPHTLRARMRKLGIDWRRFRPSRPDRTEPSEESSGDTI